MKLTPGSNKCQCPTCGEFFLNVAAFDAHRELVSKSPAYRRSCMTPQASDWALQRDPSGFWRLPKREFDKEAA